MKSILVSIGVGLFVSLIVFLIGDVIKTKLGIKDKQIELLESRIKALQDRGTNTSKKIDILNSDLKKVSSDLWTLVDIPPKLRIKAIKDYRKYIQKIDAINTYLEATKRDTLPYSPSSSYSDLIAQEDLLDSLYNTCSLYTYHSWFAEKDIYNLPIPALIQMAKLFQTIEDNCYSLPENITRMREDKWYSSIAYGLLGIPFIAIPGMKEKYNIILDSTNRLLKIMDLEEEKIQPPP